MPNNNRIRLRNPIARAAILRKGGVHNKTNKAKRQKQKQSFKKDIRAGKFGSFSLSKKKHQIQLTLQTKRSITIYFSLVFKNFDHGNILIFDTEKIVKARLVK